MKIEIDIPDDELMICASCSGEMNLTLNVNETIDGYDITSIVSDTYDGNASLNYKKIEDWTKCSDDLPDMDVEVLGTTKRYGDVVKVARWKTTLEASGWEWMLIDDIEGNAYKPDEIIAWMPLPEGYKENVCRGRRLSDEESQAALTMEQIEQQKVIHDMKKYLDRENK